MLACWACCLVPVRAHKAHKVKRERQAKRELRDPPDRWDQKAIRVRPAQWGRSGRKATKDLKAKLERPVRRAPRDSEL